MEWHNITMGQYQQMKEVFAEQEMDEVEKGIALVSILFDCDANKLLLTDFNSKLQQVKKVLSMDIPKSKVKANYGNYQLVAEPTTITTNQYVDLATFKEREDMVGILSCILIPKNHIYNDGYDIEEVRDYILKMPITDAFAILNFFMTACYSYVTHSLKFFLMRTVTSRKERKMLKQQIEKLHQKIMGFCRSF